MARYLEICKRELVPEHKSIKQWLIFYTEHFMFLHPHVGSAMPYSALPGHGWTIRMAPCFLCGPEQGPQERTHDQSFGILELFPGWSNL